MTVRGPTILLSNLVKMPAVGLGTWQSAPQEAKIAVRAALNEGYRLIDTAATYQNEEAIGEVLKEFFNAGKLKREDVFITTKAFAQHLHPDKIEQGIRASLKRLDLEYVDLYLAHCPTAFNDDVTVQDHSVTVEDIWRGLESVYDKKLTRAIGVSNFNESQVERIFKVAKTPIHNIQVELHLYLAQFGLEKIAKANNISLTSYATLGSPGRVNFNTSVAGVHFKPAPSPFEDPEVLALARKYKKTPAQILLRLQVDRGIAVIPKSVTPARIHENFQLTEEEVTRLLKTPQLPRRFEFEFAIGHPEYQWANER